MRKIKYLFLSCLTLILCFSMTACVWRVTRYFYNYHVIWYSDDPFIEFVGDDYDGIGKLTLDGIEYNICIGCLNSTFQYADFKFYNHDTHEQVTKIIKDLIWEGTAEVKKDKLILKIKKDNISNYAGKTLILNQRPVEEDT